MKAFLTGLTAVAVLGLMTGVSQAFLVTHSTAGTLFYDDMDEAEGETMAAEVGTWGLGTTTMISGPVDGGPDGAASGDTYLERGRGSTLSDAPRDQGIATRQLRFGPPWGAITM